MISNLESFARIFSKMVQQIPSMELTGESGSHRGGHSPETHWAIQPRQHICYGAMILRDG
jgi:hypothetical protein